MCEEVIPFHQTKNLLRCMSRPKSILASKADIHGLPHAGRCEYLGIETGSNLEIGGRTTMDIASLTSFGILVLARLVLPVRSTEPESLSVTVERLLTTGQTA